jgi:hypothetical protein
MVINTKSISRIYITDKSKWIVDGRSVGYVSSRFELPSVTICFTDGCISWTENWNGYEQALKLYEWFLSKAQ